MKELSSVRTTQVVNNLSSDCFWVEMLTKQKEYQLQVPFKLNVDDVVNVDLVFC